MSGHITRMSRGSRVGSSWSRPTSTSRSTSTCRAVPWQACTWTDRSRGGADPGRERRGVGRAVGAEVGLQPAEQRRRVGVAGRRLLGVEVAEGAAQLAGVATQRGEQRVLDDGRPSRRRRARTGPAAAVGASADQSTGEGWGSQRWTSRCSPRARSSSTSVTGQPRVPEEREPAGQVEPVGPPSRSRSSVVAWRTSGAGRPRRARRAAATARPASAGRRRAARRRRRCRTRRASRGRAAGAGRRRRRTGRRAAAPRRSGGRSARRSGRRGRGGGARSSKPGSSRQSSITSSSGHASRSGLHGSSASRSSSIDDQRVGRHEVDARAHAVAAPGPDAEPVGEPLGQPALDAARRHHHDLAGERIGQRGDQQVRQAVGERVGALGGVEVQGHGATL